MDLTKKHKVYLGVLALALVGLGADRLFLGGAGEPQDAAAETPAPDRPARRSPATAEPAALADVAPDTLDAASTAGNGLAARLTSLAETHRFDLTRAPQGFTPSPKWVSPVVEPAKAAATPRPTVAVVTPHERFAGSHKLMAVIQSEGGGVAIVDNRTVAIGQAIDGFTLKAVTRRTAVFERDGRTVELSIAAPNATNVKP